MVSTDTESMGWVNGKVNINFIVVNFTAKSSASVETIKGKLISKHPPVARS